MAKKRTKAQIEADAKRTGRPPISPEDVRGTLIAIRVTRKERIELAREAEQRGITISKLLMLPWRKDGKGKNESF